MLFINIFGEPFHIVEHPQEPGKPAVAYCGQVHNGCFAIMLAPFSPPLAICEECERITFSDQITGLREESPV